MIKDENLYYVGGYVRDEILGLSSLDIDYCYMGNALEFARDLNIVKSNHELCTVRVLDDGKEIDIASTRTEFYPKPGHLPVIDKIGCLLAEDLMRRDFSINSLAKNTLTGEIFDYFNGLSDIKNKKIRVLHDKSFIDDPSRIVRALKFSVRLNFDLDDVTKKLQDEYLDNINYDMSYHRLKKELKEAFSIRDVRVFERFIKDSIYKLLGENQKLPNLGVNVENLIKEFLPTLPYMVYLGLFDLSNFDLTTEEKLIIESYVKIKKNIPKSDVEIYKLFKNLPLEAVLLYAINVNYDIAKKYLLNLRNISIETNGTDLLSLGFKQGAVFGEILDYILKCKIEAPNLSKEDEINIIKKIFC